MRGGLTPCMNGYSRPRELRSSPCVTTHPITGPSTKPQSPPLTGALSWRASVPCEARAGMLVHATSIALVPASAAEPKRQLRAALIESRGDPTTRPAKEAIAALVALRPPAPSVCIQRRPISAVPLTGIGRRARPLPRCRCPEQPGSSLGACSGASTRLDPPQPTSALASPLRIGVRWSAAASGRCFRDPTSPAASVATSAAATATSSAASAPSSSSRSRCRWSSRMCTPSSAAQ